MFSHRVERGCPARARYDDRHGTLAPFLVRHRDDDGLRHIVVREQRSLESDAADPLAARLHQILRPILDRYAAASIDGHDVAGAEPPVAGESIGGLWRVVVRPRHPGSPDLELAHGLPIP